MNDPIGKRLISMGQRELRASKKKIYSFTGDAEADELVNDLKRYPHAFLIACIADRQQSAERAWLLPKLLRDRIGSFEFSKLRSVSKTRLRRIFSARPRNYPKKLHIYPNVVADSVHAALEIVDRKYDGNAAKIWSGRPSSAGAVYRFLEFPGIGTKIATMAVNILACHLNVPFGDTYSIDISPDRHVKRVFTRLGLIRERAPNEELIYRARSLWPEFPGLLDGPAFRIGRKWCSPTNPNCGKCDMCGVCPSVGSFSK